MSRRGSYQKRTYRKWSIEEKRAAVARLGVCTAGALAAELGVARSLLKTWREQIQALDKKEHREQSKERALERENLRLKQALATKVLEADFFKGVLRNIEAQRQPSSGSGETVFTTKSAKSAEEMA